MATIGHVILRNQDRFCYGLVTSFGSDLFEFFANVGPHVPAEPAEAFKTYFSWREQVVPAAERLRYDSRFGEGFEFQWTPPAEDVDTVLWEALLEAQHRITDLTEVGETEAYLVGYGHSACHLLVDLNARRCFVFDSAGDGEVVPVEDSVDYAYHVATRDRHFASYPTPESGPIDLPQPTVPLPEMEAATLRGRGVARMT